MLSKCKAIVSYSHANDLDGKMSSAIVRKYCLDRNIPFYLLFGDYNTYNIEEVLKASKIIEDDRNTSRSETLLIFTDFFPTPNTEAFNLLHSHGFVNGSNMMIIDHHDTLIKTLQTVTWLPYCFVGTAGCELTWNTLFPNRPTPIAVQLLGRYDVFDKQHQVFSWNTICEFQWACRQWSKETPNNLLELLEESTAAQNGSDDTVNNGRVPLLYKTLAEGKTLFAKQKKDWKELGKKAFRVTYNCMQTLCLNSATSNGMMFDSVRTPEDELMIVFSIAQDKQTQKLRYNLSLYAGNDTVHAGEIARAIGNNGGGHKGVGGSQASVFSFNHDSETGLHLTIQ